MNQNESTREKLFRIDREIKEMLDTIRVMEILYPSVENLLKEEDKKVREFERQDYLPDGCQKGDRRFIFYGNWRNHRPVLGKVKRARVARPFLF